MSTLSDITGEINTSLQTGQFSSKKYQKGRFSAIAELIPKKDNEKTQLVPAIISDNGDATRLNMDDTYTFEVYHRHLGSVYDSDEEDSYGSRITRIEDASMKMVVMGDRSRLKSDKEDLIRGIIADIPLEMSEAFLLSNSLQQVNINPGTFNIDSVSVYGEEFGDVGLNLKPNTIIFSLDYNIVVEQWVPCIDICI